MAFVLRTTTLTVFARRLTFTLCGLLTLAVFTFFRTRASVITTRSTITAVTTRTTIATLSARATRFI
ncbi:hypothetical protein D3C87_1861570 [compost metagenome]